METEENKNAGNGKSDQKGGFDLNGLMSHPLLGDLIKHLLSGGGAVLVNYLLSIKPMQEKIEALEKQIAELAKKHNEIATDLDEKFEKEGKESVDGANDEYFSIRKRKNNRSNRRKYI